MAREEPARPGGSSWRQCWRTGYWCSRQVWRASRWLLNAVMLLLAIGQVTILISLLWNLDWPVPISVAAAIDQRLAPHDLRLEWSRARFDLAGWVRVDGPRLRQRSTGDVWAEATQASAHFNIIDLLWGEARPRSLYLDGGKAFVPAQIPVSPSDSDWLSGTHLALRRSGEWWHIRVAQTWLWNLHLTVSGQCGPNWTWLLPSDQASFQPASLTQKYLSTMRRLTPLLKYREAMQAGWGRVHIEAEGLAPPVISIEAGAAALHWEGWSLDEPRLSMPSLFPKRSDNLPAVMTVNRVTGPADWPILEGLLWRGLFGWQEEGRLDLGGASQLAVGAISWRGKAANGFVVRLEGILPRCQGQALLWWEGRPLQVAAAFDPISGEGRCEVESRLDLADLLDRLGLATPRFREALSLPVPPLLRARASFGPGWNWREATFAAEVNRITLLGLPILAAQARGYADRNQVRIEEIVAANPAYEAVGSFFYNWDNGDWRVLVKGAIFPTDLNSMLKDWWDRLWTFLHFPDMPARADVDVRSNWHHSESTEVFATAAADAFIYCDLPIDRARLRLRERHGQLEIWDLQAETEGGWLAGSLGWHYPSPAIPVMQTQFDFTGALPPAVLAGLAPELVPWLRTCSFPNTPRFAVRGWYDEEHTDQPFPPPATRYIDLAMTADGLVQYRGVPILDPIIRARLDGNRCRLDLDQLGLADGQANCRLTFPDLGASPSPLEIEGQLRQADFEKAADVFNRLLERSPQPAAENAEPIGGRLEASFRGEGWWGDWNSLRGQGRLEVKEADFGRIHIFGLLSRLMGTFGLRFTSFNLTSAQGQFELLAETVKFEKLVFSGPTVNVDVKGTLARKDTRLDCGVTVQFVRKEDSLFKKVMGSVLFPISQVFALHLTGTIEDPQWRFIFDPRSWRDQKEGTDFTKSTFEKGIAPPGARR